MDKMKKQDPNPNPRDILEGSFDIISSGSHFVAKAEVLLTVLDVLKALPEFRMSSVTIYVNHTKILRAILLFYKIDEIYHNEILKYIYEFYQNDSKLEEALKSYSKLNSLNERQVSSFLTLLKCEGPIDLIHKRTDRDTKLILYSSGKKIGNLFKEGLKEILQVMLLVTSSGLSETDDILDPDKKFNELAEKLSSSDSYKNDLARILKFRAGVSNDPNCYSNFMFKVVVSSQDNRKADTIAVGGDFKELLEQWQSVNNSEVTNKEPLPSAFGVNFLLEDMVNIVSNPQKTKVLILSGSQDHNSVQVFSFMKSLWERGIRAELSFPDDKSVSHAYHVVTFSKDSITIDTDKMYVKNLGLKEDKKFKALKIDEALKYLIDVESKYDQVEAAKKQNFSARNRSRQRLDSYHSQK
jgi:histidyl-tRNA synthetase